MSELEPSGFRHPEVLLPLPWQLYTEKRLLASLYSGKQISFVNNLLRRGCFSVYPYRPDSHSLINYLSYVISSVLANVVLTSLDNLVRLDCHHRQKF